MDSADRDEPPRESASDEPSPREIVRRNRERLDAADPEERAAAVKAIGTAGEDDPAALRPIVSDLRELLTDRSPAVRAGAAMMFGELAREYPQDARTAAAALRERLGDDSDAVRDSAARALGLLAQSYPEDVRPAAADLRELLTDEDSSVRRMATAAIGDLASEYPETARPAVADLRERLTDADRNTRHRAAYALALVAEDDPDAARPAIPDLAERLSDEFEGARHTALLAFVPLAAAFPDEAAEAADPLAARLTEENADLRGLASRSLRSAAKTRPDRVVAAVERRAPDAGRALLDDLAPDLVAAVDGLAHGEFVDLSGPVHEYAAVTTDGPDAGTEVAVRALAPEHADDEAARGAFDRAAREWAGIDGNPGVASVIDRGSNPRPWVAYVPGERPLIEAVADLARDEGVRVIEGVCEAVSAAGRYNVSHGSIAPDAVTIAGRGESLSVAVADWGLSRAVPAAAGAPPVTPYTAPEQLDGGAAPTTDVYRVGALAYRVLAGRDPGAGADDLRAWIESGDLRPASAVEDVPEAVDGVLARATARDPAERFESVAAFRGALADALR